LFVTNQPHNIIVEQDQKGDIICAKIVDFGTAYQIAAFPKDWKYQNPSKPLIGCSEAVGTSGYSGKFYCCFVYLSLIFISLFPAPELFSNAENNPVINYAFPADLFSYAIIMWEMMVEDCSKIRNPLQGINPINAYAEVRVILKTSFRL
jgi:hypothetical protein